MAEKVEIIDIDAKNAMKTLKDLKDEVKELRKALDNCEIGSDEFTDTLNQLTDAQKELKNATKSSTEAMEGSYDSLVKKMAELKEQWRATANEIERTKLGTEIADINQQLKDMDAELGNYQRNVGNYSSAFEGVTLKFEDGVGKFEKLNTVSQDVIGSFDILEGGLKAIGVESEVVSGLMDKLGGAMKMTQGFKSVTEGVGNFKALAASVKASTVALSGFKKALISTGIGAAIVAVASLIAYWDELVALFDDAETKIKDIETASKQLDKTISQNSGAIDYYVRLAEAMGKSREEVLKLQKEQILSLMLEYQNMLSAVEAKMAKESNEEVIAALQKQADSLRNEIDNLDKQLTRTKQDIEINRVSEETNSKKEAEAAAKQRAETAKQRAEELRRQKEEELKIIEDYEKEAKLALLSEQDRELKVLETEFEDKKKLYEKYGKDITNIQLEYLNNVAEVIAKYDEQEKQRLKKIKKEKEEILLKDLNSNLSAIQSDSESKQKNANRSYEESKIGKDEDDELELIQAEINLTLELQKIKDEAFNNKIEQINATLLAEELSAEKRKELEQQLIDIENQKVDAYKDSTLKIKKLNADLSEEQKKRNRELAQNIITTSTTALSSVQTILSSIQSNIDTSNKEGFEKSKKMQIANATIGMLVGITNALAGQFTTKTGPWDLVLAGIQAATIAASGAIQISQISKQKFDANSSSNSGSTGVNFTPPTINTGALMSSPVSYISEIQGANSTSDATDNRVYVVESDISDTQKKVSVAEEEATF
jgi:hypothetical protein